MKTTKSQQTEILKEMGNLLFLAYNGTDAKIATPSAGGFTDVLEGLQYLRIIFKYQQFDLEATRREVDFLKSLLKDGK